MLLRRRQVLALGGLGAVAAVTGAVIGVLERQSARGASELLSYSFQDLEGRGTRLRDWQQKLILCNFWATWCGPCREEVPLLIAAKQKFSSNGLEIAGIGIDSAAKLRSFAQEYRINYPVLTGGVDTGELLRALGDAPAALPYSVLLDAKRRISYHKLGAWSKTELEREILAAIG